MAESELLARLLAGDDRAFRELVSTYQSAMRAVAYAIVGSRHADEVVQDAWLSVVRNLAGFEGRSSLKTWLLTITANAAKNRYKQNRREVLLDDLPSPHGTIGDDRFSNDGHWLLAPLASGQPRSLAHRRRIARMPRTNAHQPAAIAEQRAGVARASGTGA